MDMWITFLQKETADASVSAKTPVVIDDDIVNLDKKVANSSEKTSNGTSYFSRLMGV
jgi:hypothetical protein